jgi:hypothetical protein
MSVKKERKERKKKSSGVAGVQNACADFTGLRDAA